MVEFIKNSSNFGLYILESEAVGNDDWKGDHDHMKEADMDLYSTSEGIFLGNVRTFHQVPQFKFDLLDFYLGDAADLSIGEGHDFVICTGSYGGTSEQNRTDKKAAIQKLFRTHLKSSAEVLYLGVRKIGEVWEPFENSGGTTKYYLEGKMLNPDVKRVANKQYYDWKIGFRGIA